MLRHLRNPLYFASAMALPGIVAILRIVLPESGSWGHSGWSAFAIAFPLYTALYTFAAFTSFAVASILLRRFASIARIPLLMSGVVAGVFYILVGYTVDPLWSEQYFVVAWVIFAFVASVAVLLRWGRRDG